MRVIPVLDLMDGVVVHAFGGQRALYAPIATPLCASSDPTEVLAAFLGIYPFDRFYIADLNALQGKPSQHNLIIALSKQFPTLCFWVDGGFSTADSFDCYKAQTNIRPVLATESIEDVQLLQQVEHAILSLDFNADTFIGNKELLQEKYWPNDIIVMTLAQVGSHKGPDMNQLRNIQSRTTAHIYAAGGVRDIKDLQQLEKAGISGALIASALHNGKLTTADFS